MFSFITLLFFAVTGVTLNHPEWLGSSGKEGVTVNGTLKPEAINGEKVDWLKVVEQVRAEHSVRGAAVEMRVDSGEGSFAFRSPGSIAECFFDLKTGKYELKTDTPSVLATVNDLHRGRDAGRAWFWFIDASGYLLTLVSLTGLGILFYLKKSRVAGFVLAGIGLLVFGSLAWLAVR